MHGVKREKNPDVSSQARAARKAKEAARIQAYTQAEAHVFQLREQGMLDASALQQTTHVLTLNPELYTVWNYRREILLHLWAAPSPTATSSDVFASLRDPGPSSSSTSNQGEASHKHQLLQDDLMLTEHALRAHPKVYWIWNHRTWCLHALATQAAWETELSLVDRMLQLDPRNFHGWNYRRYITAQLERDTDADELAFALRKIENNFSNYSAWHQRSKLLPRTRTRGLGQDEFELVKQAMYTDPEDQSVWIYHRWLVEQDPTHEVLTREVEAIAELLELEPESKWCHLSLAHYKTLLARLTPAPDRHALETAVQAHLETLIAIDPDRRARYRDILSGTAHF